MTALVQPDFFAEHAWLIGEDEEPAGLTPAARHLRETRIMAIMFKRRWRLIVQWRGQKLQAAIPGQLRPGYAVRSRATADGDIAISTNLPLALPILGEELALQRAFLSQEIDRILFGES